MFVVIRILSIVALLFTDIYLWLNTELASDCTRVAWLALAFAVLLQAVWAFFVLKPRCAIDLIVIILKLPWQIRRKQSIETSAKLTAVACWLVYGVFSVGIFWGALRGGYFVGGFQCL